MTCGSTFDLREDLVKTLKLGDRFDVCIPALADRRVTVEVKLIAKRGIRELARHSRHR